MAPPNKQQAIKKRRPAKSSILSGTPGGDKENQPVLSALAAKTRSRQQGKARKPGAPPLQSIHDLSKSSPNDTQEFAKPDTPKDEPQRANGASSEDFHAKVTRWLEQVSTSQDQEAGAVDECPIQSGSPGDLIDSTSLRPSQVAMPLNELHQPEASGSKPRGLGRAMFNATSNEVKHDKQVSHPSTQSDNLALHYPPHQAITSHSLANGYQSPIREVDFSGGLGKATDEPLDECLLSSEMAKVDPVAQEPLEADEQPPVASRPKRLSRATNKSARLAKEGSEDQVLLTDDLVRLLPSKRLKRSGPTARKGKVKAPIPTARTGDEGGPGIETRSSARLLPRARGSDKRAATYGKGEKLQQADTEVIELDEANTQKNKERSEYWKQIDNYELDVEPVLWI